MMGRSERVETGVKEEDCFSCLDSWLDDDNDNDQASQWGIDVKSYVGGFEYAQMG